MKNKTFPVIIKIAPLWVLLSSIWLWYCDKDSPTASVIHDIQQDSVLVGLYIDDAIWSNCKTSTELMLNQMNIPYRKINPDSICQGKLAHYSMLLMPGGRFDAVGQNLGAEGISMIKTYVNSGGGYFGICGGAYFASAQCIWRGWSGEPRINFQYSALGLFNGTADGPIEDFAPSYRDVSCHVKIVDKTHPIIRELPDTIIYVYDHGPMFITENESRATVLGRSEKGDKMLLVATQYGQGRVFLTSGHPEFDGSKKSWILVESVVQWCSKQ